MLVRLLWLANLRLVVALCLLGGVLHPWAALAAATSPAPAVSAAPADPPVPPVPVVPPVSVEIRWAGEGLARMLDKAPSLESAFGLLCAAGVPYDPELAVPTRFVRECRHGRALSTLLGLYRADYAYALAFGQKPQMPLLETLAQVDISPAVQQGLEQGWAWEKDAVQGARAHLVQTMRQLTTVEDVRAVMDIIYGSLLEQAHILSVSLLRLPPERWDKVQVDFAPPIQAVVKRVDDFRTTLQRWTRHSALVRDLGLHADIILLERVQTDLEMLLLQPALPLAQAVFTKVEEERRDLVRLCKIPPKEEKGSFWQLETRDDLFKPRNFF